MDFRENNKKLKVQSATSASIRNNKFDEIYILKQKFFVFFLFWNQKLDCYF